MPIYKVQITQHAILKTNQPTPTDKNDILAFLEANRAEINFATELLKDTPANFILYCHYKDQQLSYTDEKGEVTYLNHTYRKINGVIYLEMKRNDILGEGSFAAVKKLVDVETGEIAPLKMFKKTDVTEQNAPDLVFFIAQGKKINNPFKNRAYSTTLSPKIKLIYDHTQNPTQKFFKKEKTFHLLQYGGVSFEDLIEKNKLTSLQLIEIPLRLIRCFIDLHRGEFSRTGQGYVHRDIKAENVLFLLSGKGIKIVPCDIDPVLLINKEEKTAFTEKTLLTPNHAAPELLRCFPAPSFSSLELSNPQKKEYNNRFLIGTIPNISQIHPITKKLSVQYSTMTDCFSVGETLSRLLHHKSGIFLEEKLKIYIIQVEKLSALMLCYNPQVRFPLPWIELALFYFYCEEKNRLTGFYKNLYLLPEDYQHIALFSACLLLASRFAPKTPEYWPLLEFILIKMDFLFFKQKNTVDQNNFLTLLELLCYLNVSNSPPLEIRIIRFLWENNKDLLNDLLLLKRYALCPPKNGNALFNPSPGYNGKKNINTLASILKKYDEAQTLVENAGQLKRYACFKFTEEINSFTVEMARKIILIVGDFVKDNNGHYDELAELREQISNIETGKNEWVDAGEWEMV